MAKRTKWALGLYAVGVTYFLVRDLIDVLVGMGWGAHWKNVLIDCGMLLWGAVVYLACLAMFRFVDGVRGPE